jgi:dethiobiotin synthetase
MVVTGLFITGTDTGAGKTVAAGSIAAYWRAAGVDVGVMKPAETGCRTKDGDLVPADASFLKKVSGASDLLDEICPYRFAEPVAPAVAAKRAGTRIDKRLILKRYMELAARHEFMLVEGAGGLLVPLSGKYLCADLVADMGLPIVIVGRLGLGTINHTLLTVEAARARGLEVYGIILNQCRPGVGGVAEATNPQVIRELSGIGRVFTLPFMPGAKRSLRALSGSSDVLAKQGFFGLTSK